MISNHSLWLSILRETFVIGAVLCLSSQSSSIVRRLVLIPTRISLMLIFYIETLYSGILTFIFIIVFIGGLMVLLVSATSVVYQDQWVVPSIRVVVISPLILFISERASSWNEDYTRFLSWLDNSKITLVWISLVILVIGLFVITFLLIEYKGITRRV